MDSGQTSSAASVFEFIERIESQHGLPNAVLVVLLAVIIYAFKQMLWQVWKDAARVRDREIERLAKEREVYQAMVFQRLRALEANSIPHQGQPDNAGTANGNSSTNEDH